MGAATLRRYHLPNDPRARAERAVAAAKAVCENAASAFAVAQKELAAAEETLAALIGPAPAPVADPVQDAHPTRKRRG